MPRLLGKLDVVRRGDDADFVLDCLSSVRRHLGMEIAYLAELRQGMMIFRAVDAPGFEELASPGDEHPASEVYCKHIMEGTLPRLIPDTRREPLAMSLDITHDVPVGSHIGIPVRRRDGTIYGMFCCLSRTPMPTLNERDLEVAEMFAGLIAEHVDRSLQRQERRADIASRLRETIRERQLYALYQPIVDLRGGRAACFEALCRFPAEPGRAPILWFTEAAEVGLTVELEIAAIEAALEALTVLPDGVRLSINVSSETIASDRLEEVLSAWPLSRIVLEVTEHVAITDYPRIARRLAPLRRAGAKLAVDDSGAGSAGLQQIVRLDPDYVKLDASLTAGIEADVGKRALAAAMVHYARETGAMVTAEGIETTAALSALRALGVHHGQGWHLGHPGTLDAAIHRVARLS
jgi:EAL domain-containing protein (putative c-di-GMP-specific phosphodiesterase class I)